MDKKFFILLFAVVFCNGVVYSSPVEGRQISDPKPSTEEKQQPMAEHINKKIESTAISSVQPSPVSSTPAPSQVPTLKKETVHPAATSTSVPQPVSLKNVTQDNSKNTTQVVIDNKNMNQTTERKNSSTSDVDKNSSQSTTHVPVPTDSVQVPTGKAITDMPRPTTPGETTTVTPAMAVPVNKTETQTTNKASTTTKSTVVTHSPTPKESVVIENNVPAPAEEKHFDGPSFIGGIVLTIGLTAIGFIAFKYYKSGKIDMNYRTL